MVTDETRGAPPSKTDQLRENDLKRHFKARGRSELAATPRRTACPTTSRTGTSPTSCTDYQLKVALNYLNGVAPSFAPPAGPARAANTTR